MFGAAQAKPQTQFLPEESAFSDPQAQSAGGSTGGGATFGAFEDFNAFS